jgi:hypothetical protein
MNTTPHRPILKKNTICCNILFSCIVNDGMKKIQLLFYCSTLLLAGCWDWGKKPIPPSNFKKVWGYKPIFTYDSSLFRVESGPPVQMKNPGNIYVRGSLIFQVDAGYGVHVIDNSNPSQVRAIGFLKVNGCSEISIKDNNMYVNSFNALLTLDITDWQNVRVVKRIDNAFQQGLYAGGYRYYFIPPPEHGVYYDCSLPGYQVGMQQSGWVRDSVFNYCFYK